MTSSINSLLYSAKGIDKGILANSEAIKSGGVSRTVSTSVNKHGITEYKIERIDTRSTLSLITESFSELQRATKIQESISKFDKYINPTINNPGGEVKKNPRCISMLSEIVIEKFRQINSNNQIANLSKQVFVQSLKTFADSINDFSEDLHSEFNGSISAIKSDMNSANSVIDKIYQNNIKIRGSSSDSAINYLDRRDELISELSNYLNFQVKFDSKGAVKLMVGNSELIGEDRCSTIVASESNNYQEIGEFVDNEGRFRIGLQSSTGQYTSINDLRSGSISGCLELINNKLPEYKKMINEYAINSAEVLNYANSFGISEKGNQRFVSTKKTTLDSVMRDTTINTISAVKDGKSIGDDRAKILAYDFDFEGKTVAQALKEINQKLNVGTSQKSITGIGNIKLVNSSKAGNILSFNLEFENFQDFETKFHIAGISYDNAGGGYNEIDQRDLSRLNLTTEVEAGKCVLNSQQIAVNFAAANAGSKIKLKVNAVGADGKITPLEVEYTDIDMSAVEANEIYYLNSANAAANNAAPVDYNINKTSLGFAPALVAKFVNKSGVEIKEGEGYISIEGIGDNNVIMCDKFRSDITDVSKRGLISSFGMNNLIDISTNPNYKDSVSNVKISVKEEVLFDPTKISASGIIHPQSEFVSESGREDAIKLAFSSTGAIINLGAGDTITLNILGREYEFTFDNNSDGMNVQVGMGFADSVKNLYDKLRNHADLSQMLDFQYDAPLILSIKSKVKGDKRVANPINVAWALNDGFGDAQIQTLNYYNGNEIAAADADANTDLQNGTDETKNTFSEKSAFSITSISNETIEIIANIIQNKTFSFTDSSGTSKTFSFELSSAKLFETLNDISLSAEGDSEYSKAKSEDVQNSWAEEIGIDLQKIRMEVDKLTNFKYAIIDTLLKIMASNRDITRMIAAA
jgi:flagellar hook-associated protein FlgK